MQKDVVIVGAGIVGLATGYQLLKLRPHLKIVILEKENDVAKHQTGNNSGVVHSGIYYKPGSLKAKNCMAGKNELLAFCAQNGIATKKLGKVIVATEEAQRTRLSEIETRGRANGVHLERICRHRLKEIEPNVEALEALWIPDCSVVSYRQVALKLAEAIQVMGGELHCKNQVEAIETEMGGIRIVTGKNEFRGSKLVNCAGLFSDRIAKLALGKEKVSHQILPFRGEYYELREEKRHLVNGLVYPVPDPRFPFLGVHLTRMIDGKVEAGPNAILASAREGYLKADVNLKDCWDMARFPGFWRMAAKYWKAGVYEMARSYSKKLFLRDLQKLVPAICEKDLIPGGAGIRAQVVTRDGKLGDDFSILQEKNMVHVLNAPSPAATASFSIGRQIAELTLNI
jgi:L-2-hydroxyglutarate oxidase LhgO